MAILKNNDTKIFYLYKLFYIIIKIYGILLLDYRRGIDMDVMKLN